MFHVIVIVMSLVMTLSAWQFSKRQLETRTSARFDVEREQVIALITARMLKYEDALWAGVSAIESHGADITFREWRAFASTLRIDEKYPGISGIGVIHYVTDNTLSDYMAKMQWERPPFNIHPAHGQPFYIPISFIEPEGPNSKAVGLDVAFEKNRREGALAARDSGEARITGPIYLVQNAAHTPGFLFYAPFYRGKAPTTLEERRDRIAGAVYAPFVTRKLVEGLLAKDLRGVHFSIMDAGETIYDEHATDDLLNDPDPMYRETVSIDVYGRTWALDLRTNLAFREANTYAQPTFILIGGLLIEGLIIALLVMMARANGRAVAYADKMTVALREESEKLTVANSALSSKNEELEQFAYVTSHDLKTPIRGIGGLTEMLQDDLQDYLASADANPDVNMNIQRIKDRVDRMHQLTGGIMEFSRVGRFGDSDAPVSLTEVVEAMRMDFGLTVEQLRLEGTIPTIYIDTFSFRRVIENLIGNAIKYHDDPQNLAIDVVAQSTQAGVTVAITDNGPGIDPKYHGKIFDMFQTLRGGRGPESTGIGLAIVKKAVERHGGRIAVTSSPGTGATFTFDWPMKAADGSSASVGEAA